MNTKDLMVELYRRYESDMSICVDIDCEECPFYRFDVCPNNIEA